MAVYRIEQMHRTHVLEDQYIVVTDLSDFTKLTETSAVTVVEATLDALHDMVTTVCHEFGGVVRFSAGDAYCLTFTNAERVMAGVDHLMAAWDAFGSKVNVPCGLDIAVHLPLGAKSVTPS